MHSRLPQGHQPCSLRHISSPMKAEEKHEITSECASGQGSVDHNDRDKRPTAHLPCVVPNEPHNRPPGKGRQPHFILFVFLIKVFIFTYK